MLGFKAYGLGFRVLGFYGMHILEESSYDPVVEKTRMIGFKSLQLELACVPKQAYPRGRGIYADYKAHLIGHTGMI